MLDPAITDFVPTHEPSLNLANDQSEGVHQASSSGSVDPVLLEARSRASRTVAMIRISTPQLEVVQASWILTQSGADSMVEAQAPCIFAKKLKTWVINLLEKRAQG